MGFIRKHKVLTAFGGVAALLLVIFAAIGANTHPRPAASSTPSATATHASPSSTPSTSIRTTLGYSSAQQVVTALGRRGLPCTGGSHNTPVVSGATSETLCDLSPSGQALIDVFSGIVSNATVLKNSVSTGTEQIFSVVGSNWWVQVSHADASRVQAILGGRIIAGPWHPQARSTPSPSPTLTHSAAPPPAPTTSPAAPPPASCYPTTDSGHCYEPGEYCRNSDHGASGVAGDGEKILCEDNNGWRWEPV
jgi:hypothetical protein